MTESKFWLVRLAGGIACIPILLAGCGGGGEAPLTMPMPSLAAQSQINTGPRATLIISASDSVVRVGGTVQLSANIATPGAAVPAKSVAWSSSDAAVATVTANGVVRGASAGSVQITAKLGALSATTTITVRTIEVLDAHNSGTPAFNGFTFRPETFSPVSFRPAQSFIAQNSGTISRVDLEIICYPYPYAGSGDIELEVFPFSTPMGTPIAAATIPAGSVVSACATATSTGVGFVTTVTANFAGSTGVLVADQKYMLKANSSAVTQSEAAYWAYTASQDSYVPGTAYALYPGGSWFELNPALTIDFIFSLYVNLP
jgi:hypothetical protein